MRIAEINDVASVASEIGRGLRRRGHEVTLIRPRLVGARLPARIKPLVAPLRAWDWLRIVRRVRAGRFDVLHIHYAYLGVIGLLGRKPYVLHCHGGDVWGLTPATRWPTARALRGAAHVFYSTPDLAPHTLRYRPDAEFLPNPIDWQTFAAATPAAESDAVYIACALDDLKGALVILDACRRLAAARPAIRITAIANGRYIEDFRVLPNVTLLPFQRRADLPSLIGRHGVVIGQVNLGAAGMAELEAMACARPVISLFTFASAYPEPPPFVPARSGAEIASAVVRLVEDAGERQRIGDAGRAWVRRYHDLDAISGRVEAVVLAVVGRGSSVAPAAPPR